MPSILLLEKAADAAPPNWFVVVMGVGTVFVGLICIIAICSVMGLIFRNREEKENPVSVPTKPQTTENRQEILAAVCAVAAEELGTDVSALKVISFKKI